MDNVKIKFQRYKKLLVLCCTVSFYTQATELDEQTEFFSQPYTQQLANYEVEKGARFDLCRDFRDYLNRQKPFYYFLGLKPDDLFKGFKLPYLVKVDKEYALSVIQELSEQKLQDKLTKALTKQEKIKLTEKHKGNWRSSYFLKEENQYYTAYMDVNHSGKKDHVLIKRGVYSLQRRSADFIRSPIGAKKSTFYYIPLDKEGSYRRENNFLLDGQPFFYRGRFYTAGFSHATQANSTTIRVNIYEPKVTPFTEEGVFMGVAVCNLIIREKYIINLNK